MTTSLRKIGTALGPLIRDGAQGHTDSFITAARLVVDVRGQFFVDRNGAPDWLGRSYEYREWISGVYADAAQGANRAKVTAALRYHVGNELRARLDDDTITELGLRKSTATEEAATYRKERAAVVAAVTGGTMAHTDPLRAVMAAKVLLDRADLSSADALTRQAVDSLLKVAAARIKELQKIAGR
ncbi:MAG: hypothetical protein WCK81_15435 [Betaproteobacteria bacterium]